VDITWTQSGQCIKPHTGRKAAGKNTAFSDCKTKNADDMLCLAKRQSRSLEIDIELDSVLVSFFCADVRSWDRDVVCIQIVKP